MTARLDSNVLTRDIAVTPVNDAPALSGIEVTTLGYLPRTARPRPSPSAIVASDVDNANLAGATVRIGGNYQTGQECCRSPTRPRSREAGTRPPAR